MSPVTYRSEKFNAAVRNIINHLGGDLRSGKCRCPMCERRALSVSNGEKQRAILHCFACERDREIIDHLCAAGAWPTSDRLAPEHTSEAAEQARSPDERRKYALNIWKVLRTTHGRDLTILLKDYLTSRAIKQIPETALITLPPVFVAGRHYREKSQIASHDPGMVLPVRDARGRLWGIHVVWLSEDFARKRKTEPQRQSYGVIKGHFVQLAEMDWANPPDTLIIGEGAETVLTCMQLTQLPGIASGGAGFFDSITPPHCREYIIAADNGTVGQVAADKLADRLLSMFPDCKIRIATPARPEGSKDGYDWNDAVVDARGDKGQIDGLRLALLNAPLFDPWAEPDDSLLVDRRGELPDFPIDALRGLNCHKLIDWLKRAAHGTGTSLGHVAVPMLGIASGLIGTARRVQASRSWSEPMTVWTATIGHSGSGKTPGIDATRHPLAAVEDDRVDGNDQLRRTHEARAERAKAALAEWKNRVAKTPPGKEPIAKPAEADDPGPFIPPRLFTTDATIERLSMLLTARPQGILVVIDELAGLFANMSRYSGGQDNQFWLMAWDGKPYSIERMGRPAIQLDHLLLGLVGGLQPDKLSDVFKGSADGMYSRFLFAWPQTPPHRRLTDVIEEVDPTIKAALHRLADLNPHAQDRVPLSFKARQRFEGLRKRVHDRSRRLEGRERDWAAKMPAQVLRLAGTLAYVRWAIMGGPEPKEIRSQHMDAAVRLVLDYFWPHARAALRQIGLTDRHVNERRVLRWLQEQRADQIALKDIRREALAQRLDADATRLVLDGLVKKQWLRMIVTPSRVGRGRPTVRWVVNPALFAAEHGD
jgi:hypothetical protein